MIERINFSILNVSRSFSQSVISLTERQKKIAIIVAGALGLLVAAILLFRRCCKDIFASGEKQPFHRSAGSHPLDGPGGQIRYADQTTDEGEFFDGKLNGRGIRTKPDGTVEEGEFAGGVLNGPGTIRDKQGDLFEGNFKNGKLHGQGRYVNYVVPGCTWIYEGEFENGDFKKGKKIENDKVSEGEFPYRYFLEGPGKVVYANGTVETGNFKNAGELQEQGKRVFSDGSGEEGKFNKGRLLNGKKFDAQGSVLEEGEFKDDKIFNGKGKLTFPDGTIYEGEFQERGNFMEKD